MGRIPNQDNEWAIYNDVTLNEAREKFIKGLYDNNDEFRSSVTKQHGTDCYIEVSLSSHTDITYRGSSL